MTRIWESSYSSDTKVTAAGSLFHQSIEKFNRLAATSDELHAVIRAGETGSQLQQGFLRFYNLHCLNRTLLAAKSVPTIDAFTACVHRYMKELADIVVHASSNGHSNDEIVAQLFGDKRKVVDVTFYVGPDKEPVHVTGRLDYVFYDWRVNNHRIIDYKLTASDHANNDLFQVVAYALMHHHQHRTQPDVAVFYLHPQRDMVELNWSQVYEYRHQLYDLLASMLRWERYEPGSKDGFKPPGVVTYCGSCPWDRDGYCVSTLGPKQDGNRYAGWSKRAEAGQAVEPEVEIREPEIHEIDDADHDEEQDPTTPVINEPSTHSSQTVAEDVPASVNFNREQGLILGNDADPVTMPLHVLNTHIAVVGAAGSGKTWMAKVIVEEAIRNNVPVLAVDPQGDLVQFLRRNSIEVVDPQLHDLYREFAEKVEPRIFTPGSSHAKRISLTPLRLPTAADLAHIERPERRAEELENIINATASNLVGLAKVGGEIDSQRNLLYKILRSLNAVKPGDVSLSDVIMALSDPASVGIDNVDMILKKVEREKLARKLNNFSDGPAAGLFSKGIPLDLDHLTTADTPGKTPLNVLYLNALANDDEKQFFVAMLASEIYRWMVSASSGNRSSNLLFYIDEARDYIPAKGKQPPCKDPLIRLFTQGRKYGVGCLLCTQSPRSVDYNVFGNCSTKIIGRMEAAQDVERIADWFTTDGPVPSWINQRKGADRGTFVARWPDMPARWDGTVIKSRNLFSLHEKAWTPDRVEEEVTSENPNGLINDCEEEI